MIARFALLLAVVAAAPGCGRHHTLIDGKYQFRLETPADGGSGVIRDDCLLASQSAIFSTGVISTTGHVVTMDDYQIFETPILLVGNYLTQDSTPIDRMRLDGSASNVSTTIGGIECLVDRVAIHLDSTTTNATAFAGTFSLTLDSDRHNECVCQFWSNYSASKI